MARSLIELMRRYWIEVAWGLFSAANIAVILVWGQWNTVPFHFIWVSLTLLYGIRMWGSRATWMLLVVVTAVTGVALGWSVIRTHLRPDEMTEVPLMGAMFVAMVWHAEREKAATQEVQRLADNEHRLLERERDFVRDASHELRTPITVALGHAELIQCATPDPLVAEDAEVVMDELQRLRRLAERLLLLASAEHSSFLEKTQVDLESLVVKALRRWSPNRRRWTLGPLDPITVFADGDRLTVALDALVENAVKNTQQEDSIELSVRQEDELAILSVSDSGGGIPPQHHERIFDRFTRADAGRSRGAGGVGLGLAIVRTIAEAHGGSVRVKSNPGQGSTFELLLPLSTVPPSSPISRPLPDGGSLDLLPPGISDKQAAPE
jgi:two-component system OmpR family sensor kinase